MIASRIRGDRWIVTIEICNDDSKTSVKENQSALYEYLFLLVEEDHWDSRSLFAEMVVEGALAEVVDKDVRRQVQPIGRRTASKEVDRMDSNRIDDDWLADTTDWV